MQDQPHILYIFTDQQEAGAMSCTGNHDVNTPAMDSLAEKGIRFEKTYCTFPLCTPSRASMFLGMMPHQVGISKNGVPFDKEFRLRGLGHILSNNGYECVYGGKWHIPEMTIPEGHGFRSICGFSDWDLPRRCAEFIEADHQKPFFLVASFDNPHNICEWSRDQAPPWGQIPETPLELCPNLPSNFSIPPYEPEAIRCEQRARFIYRADSYTPDDWRRYRAAYYRLVENVDAGIATILDALRRTGLEENTLIIFTSDHGDGNGAHQWNQKSILYEESVRVPLIVSFPSRIRGAQIDCEHLISNGLDLFPTICDYAGVEMPEDLSGLSWRPLMEGKANAWRDHLVVETLFDAGLGTHGLMVRTNRFKYCAYSWGKYREQLFDMENDPGEMVNLAVNARYADVLQHHRELLTHWIQDTDYRRTAHYAHPQRRPLPGQQWELNSE